jgi:hypothetical protein
MTTEEPMMMECSPPKRQRTLARCCPLEAEDGDAPSRTTPRHPIVAARAPDVCMSASKPRRMRSSSSWASSYARQLRLVCAMLCWFFRARVLLSLFAALPPSIDYVSNA